MKKKIKILSVYHKPAPLMNDKDVFIPIHGGRELFLKHAQCNPEIYTWMLENTIGDNTGDNISLSNWKYNELTVIYWAYKNWEKIGEPDYIGFSHYRRHFIFDDWKELPKRHWVVNVQYQKDNYEQTIKYSREKLEEYICEYDLIHTMYKDEVSVYEQYAQSAYHDVRDLDLCLSFIDEIYPEYSQAARNYINGKNNYFCNMFIMRKNVFFRYCEWIFPILKRFDESRNYDTLTYDEARFFISERLTGIFIQHYIESGGTHCPLHVTTIMNADLCLNPCPAYSERNIPVVFSVNDDEEVSKLGVTLTSLVINSNILNNYDIHILYESLSHQNMAKLRNVFMGMKNFSLRFLDIKEIIKNNDVYHQFINIRNNVNIKFCKFLVGKIFDKYEKLIYLSSDVIIRSDIANLYNIDLGDHWLAAVHSMRESILIKQQTGEASQNRYDYITQILKLNDPYQYFQENVLVYNVKAIVDNRLDAAYITAFENLSRHAASEQDILNVVCYKHVLFLPYKWNIECQIPCEFQNIKQKLIKKNYDQYTEALINPAILNYASYLKPWNNTTIPFAVIWWQTARQSIFYESFAAKTFIAFPFKYINCNILKIVYKILWKLSWGKARRRFKQKFMNIETLYNYNYR